MKRVGNGADFVVPLAIAGLALAAFSGSQTTAAATLADCGEWGIEMHPWVGYTASAQVLSDVARQKLGCTINQTQLDEAG
ncbi:MAG: hypothetical protein ACKO4L_14290, partial [Nodosilinea sp.]